MVSASLPEAVLYPAIKRWPQPKGIYYGEIGYEFDGGSHNLETAEKEAVKRSEKIDVVGIFDQHEELISVAIDGQIFEPRKA